MKKILVFTLLIWLFLSLSNCYASSQDEPVYKGDSLLKKLINCYSFYNLFLNETYNEKGFIISQHGENFEEILKYLKQGFSEEIALHITEYLTAYQPEIKKQIIIPKGGLPLIAEEDLPFIKYEIIEDEIIFTRIYKTDYPYSTQAIYYKIYTRFDTGGLKIYQLELQGDSETGGE